MDKSFEIKASSLPRQLLFGGLVLISILLLMWICMPESKAKMQQQSAKPKYSHAAYQPSVPEPKALPVIERKPVETSNLALESRRQAPIGVFHKSYTPSTDIENQQAQFVQARARQIEELDYTIIQGKVITAILETAINSDIAGMTRAIVKEDIYAEKGRRILIPKGSRLIGFYHSDLELGQRRIYVGWKRVIRPDGVDIDLDSPGTDALGRAGLTGHVDTKFFERFRDAALMSLISAGAANINVGKEDEYNSMSAYRQGVASSFATTANESLSRTKDMGPTIYVNQGNLIKVLVAKDLNFAAIR